MSVLNGNVLDYLLHHRSLIPKEWRSNVIFFWGTIYRCQYDLDVRYLAWGINEWYWAWHPLKRGLGADDPAALRA